MKRVVLRIGCGAVCAALALTLGCGCALLPPATGVPGAASSAVSVPTDDSGKPLYDPAVLNDSRLRVLYCDSRSGSSTTILCGSTPLHQSTRSENVSLVEDSVTGTADYWLRSWSDPTGRGGRRTALYDKTGTEVMSFEGEQSATLQNGLLVLQESRLIDGGYVPESGYGTCQVIDLATGAALPVPEGAYSCTLCGDKLVFSCYARPEGLDDYDWDTDYQQNRWVVVQEKDGTPVYRAEAASAYRLFYDSDTLSDWVKLDVATGEETTDQILYNTQTGEQYTGFLQVYPGGLASFSTSDGRYELRDMTTEDRGLISTFDEQPSQYFPGYVVTWHSGEGHGYELYDLETGAKTPLYDVDATDNTVAVYALDGSTACIPLMAQMLADTTGMDLEEARSSITVSTTAYALENFGLYDTTTRMLVVYEAPDYVKEELQKANVELEQKPIGVDALVFIVNEDNPVQALSQQQLRDIYAGKITNWKDVGGKDQEIVAFQRGEDSGSQTLFKKLLIQGGELMTPPSELAPAAMGELVDSIADYNNSANAIGFSVYYYIDQMYSKPGLRLLAVDGVTPSNDTLADGSYPLCNDFYAVIHPDAAADSPERRLYDWLDTDAGQDCIKKSGYVAVGPQTTVTIVD